MNYYELLDSDCQIEMIVKTTLEFDKIKEKWEKFKKTQYDYADQFVKQLKDDGICAERVFTEQINC